MKITVKNSLLAGMFVALTACGGGGGGGGGGSDTTQYEPGTAAPTIVAPETVNAYPGGVNSFTVNVADADTAQSNVQLKATVISYVGLPEAPTVRTTVDIGVLRAERTVYIVLADPKATGSAVVEFEVNDGAHSAKTRVNINVISDPYALQQSKDIVVTYADGSIERKFLELTTSMHVTGALQPDSALDTAARAHAMYLAAHGGIGTTETAGNTGFSGVTVSDRAKAAGYSGNSVQDVAVVVPVTSTNDVAATIAAAKIANSVYRADVMRSGAREIGIGVATANGIRVLVAVVGTKTTIQRPVATGYYDLWPMDSYISQNNENGLLENSYSAESESPSPIAEIANTCTGTAISYRLRNDQVLNTSTFSLNEVDRSGKVISSIQTKLVDATTDVNRRIGKNVAYIVPLKPLKANTFYQAHFVGQASAAIEGSTQIDKAWKFITTSFDGTSLIGCSPSR